MVNAGVHWMKYNLLVVKTKKLHPAKLMAWGCIRHSFKSRLIFLNGNVDADIYINEVIIGSDFILDADQLYGESNWYYQEDNARPHISATTISVLNAYGVNILPNWPPYSPDFRAIEIVWAIMSKRVEKTNPSTIPALRNIIQQVWDEFDSDTIDRLIDQFPIRLTKCVQLNGQQVRI